jgi:monofunctional biosynthetic peptidoglycan transglycosylase
MAQDDEPEKPDDEPPERAPEPAADDQAPQERPVLDVGPPPSSSAAEPERPLVIDTDTPNQRLDRLAPRPKYRKPFTWRDLVWKLFKWAVLVGVVLPVIVVTLFKWVPPPVTILMLQRAGQGHGLDYHWRPLSRISPNLVRAAIGAEDGKFCEHNGFDFDAIEKAFASNARGRRVRGGSTISQQTAKNVFLWPQRSWVRKGAEAYFTVLIETIWGKKRIMEVYLNVIEMGPGTYGAQAAARRYFKEDASNLTTAQASRLAAILPNPLKYRPVQSGPYVQRRSRRIGGAAGAVGRDGLAACVLSGSRARVGLERADEVDRKVSVGHASAALLPGAKGGAGVDADDAVRLPGVETEPVQMGLGGNAVGGGQSDLDRPGTNERGLARDAVGQQADAQRIGGGVVVAPDDEVVGEHQEGGTSRP